MSARKQMKRGDLLPALRCALSLSGGAAIDFTDAAVVLVLRPAGGGDAVRREATLVEFTSTVATVQYDWVEEDTAEAGEFDAEWEVTMASGKVITFPNGYYFRVSVKEDLR